MKGWILFFIFFALTCSDGQERGGIAPEDGVSAVNNVNNMTILFPEGTVIFTSVEAEKEQCLEFEISLRNKEDDSAIADASIALSFDGKGGEIGSLENETVVTDANGIATNKFCSNNTAGTAILVAKYQSDTVKSDKIIVNNQNEITFQYLGSDITSDPSQGIVLNLIDQGPEDCTYLYFGIVSGGAAVSGVNATFRSQVDFPKGSKLAEKTSDKVEEEDPITNRKYLVYKGESNSSGVFKVPLCAGVEPGGLAVSGTLKAGQSNSELEASAPSIAIRGGIVNYINMTMQYNTTNAKTARGFFNTNPTGASDSVDFSVRLAGRKDGPPLLTDKLFAVAEVGQIDLTNGGKIENDTAKFQFTARHLANYRPYIINDFGQPTIQTLCNAETVSQYVDDQGLPYIDHTKLSDNFRSTLVYMIKGQEHFHDANGNGIYDEGGDGFWDKNQNGYYDAGDVITYDAGNTGTVDMNGEWFIDLPSPFIDVNEDGAYDPNVDTLIGDVYSPPNGKRDSSTLLWKHEYIPLYMGASVFSLQNHRITSTLTPSPDTSGYAYFSDLSSRGLRIPLLASVDTKHFSESLTGADFFAADTLAGRVNRGESYLYFYAHGICGNPPPGGTEMKVEFEPLNEVEFGQRTPSAHFYIQPGDKILETSRQIIVNSGGGNTANINFNISDHPSRSYGYPIEFLTNISPCDEACTGEVQTAGVTCPAQSYRMNLTVDNTTVTNLISVGQATTCTCQAGHSLVGSACQAD